MKNWKALFFDLDNTLVNRDRAFELMMVDYLGMYGFHEGEIEECMPIILKKDNHGYLDRKRFCDWLVSYLNSNIEAEEFYSFHLKSIAKYIKTNAVVKELLNELRTNFSLILLTNGGLKNQRLKLENADLIHLFPESHRYISSVVGIKKPDRLIFENALNDHNLSAKEVLMIGDDPKNDVWGAKNVGIATCWISHLRDWPETTFFPDFTLSTLSDFIKTVF